MDMRGHQARCEMSQCFGSTPCFVCGSQAGPAPRPRYYWLDWKFSSSWVDRITGHAHDWTE
eukprot:846578-Karenia_brevis.AAC.1